MYILLVCTLFLTELGQANTMNTTAIKQFIKSYVVKKLNKDSGSKILDFKTYYGGPCRPKVYKHFIREPGCAPKRIKTKLCAGKCNSVFIPFFELSFCFRCQPKTINERKVRLKCYNEKLKKDMTYMKMIKDVKTCSCASC